MIDRYAKLLTGIAAFTSTLATAQQNALDFDGVDDEVTVNNASALIAGAAGFSLTCWVKPVAATEHQGIAGLRDEAGADFYLLKLANLNSIEARMRTSDGAFYTLTTPGLVLDAWQHLALVYNGSELVLYRNGSEVAFAAASGNITSTTGTFRIGNLVYNLDNFAFGGQVDEVSFWNTALTVDQVECIASSPIDEAAPGLQLYYRMDQGVAGGNNTAIATLTDLAGNADGTLQGFSLTGTTSNFVTGPVIGYHVEAFMCVGESYEFNGEELTAPGEYTATFPTSGLCDSTVVLQLIQAEVDNGVVQNGPTLIATASEASFQWFTCNNGTFQIINGADNQYYQAIAVGNYAVEVTQDGCSLMSDCYEVTSIGIEERRLPVFTLSPVPATDLLTVELIRPAPQAALAVVDMTGRVLLERTLGATRKLQLDVSDLSAGAYFVRMQAGDESRVQRFVRH